MADGKPGAGNAGSRERCPREEPEAVPHVHSVSFYGSVDCVLFSPFIFDLSSPTAVTNTVIHPIHYHDPWTLFHLQVTT